MDSDQNSNAHFTINVFIDNAMVIKVILGQNLPFSIGRVEEYGTTVNIIILLWLTALFE